MIAKLEEDTMTETIDAVEAVQEFQRLEDVKRFVQESAALGEFDEAGRDRGLEARMEVLLKRYGFDKVERRRR